MMEHIATDYTHEVREDNISKYHHYEHNTLKGTYLPATYNLRYAEDGTSRKDRAVLGAKATFERLIRNKNNGQDPKG